MTNLSGGLFAGLKELQTRGDDARYATLYPELNREIASVLLFTDGIANHGVTKTPQLEEMVRKNLASQSGACTLFSVCYSALLCSSALERTTTSPC